MFAIEYLVKFHKNIMSIIFKHTTRFDFTIQYRIVSKTIENSRYVSD